MADRIFRSTTALAVSLALAVPQPAPAQNNDRKFDITEMTDKQIADTVDRCLDAEARKARREETGKAEKTKNRPWADFCESYVAGDLDAFLPPDLQSATALSEPLTDAPQESTDSSGAETAAVTPDGEAATDGVGSGADTGAGSDATEIGADSSKAPDTNATASAGDNAAVQEEVADEIGEDTTASAEADATATDNGVGASGPDTGDATKVAGIEGDTSESKAPKPDMADNPELTEMDSQAQADALASDDASASMAAAAGQGNDEKDVEVREEVVTEQTARRSDEEFETKVDENVQANTADDSGQKSSDKNDDRISDLGKAALFGLGALAVGQLLNNGGRVVSNSGDRAVVEQNGQYRVLKNDDALLRQPGADLKTYSYEDGSTRTVVTRPNGVEVETVRAANGRVLRRTKTLPDGRTVVLFDDTRAAEAVVVSDLPPVEATRSRAVDVEQIDGETLAALLAAKETGRVDRRFSLSQIRNIDAVRYLVPEINVDSINFETGSAAIQPQEAEELAALGRALREMILDNPNEVFLVEGHTDATGAASYNLALSDRRAETVALALAEYFDVPPENLVVQGYGEADLAVPTLEAERANRRAAVRRITPLLNGGDSL